ncbi:ArsR family transcriptional regulator [Treponema sp. J25]|jgi:predicted transcriptional regulator|uniref:ArsR/SmtB family transcription factor n=1 Tax=Treponema sp. J25 TaxID=2094121 RepID=UPI00104E0766|nr:ArsR family transcriptional regulator [Treponema sp. J25]TCW61318.1 transcriptional regulator [Treponema sp. J25]
MIHLKDIREGTKIFKALGSAVRLEILSLLSEYQYLNMNDLAELLKISKGALTSHIRMLQEANLIDVTTAMGKKGIQKICSLPHESLVVDLSNDTIPESMYEIELDVGLFFDFKINPICGIATIEHLIGSYDDPRFFAHPDRINAGILWFASGYVEYRIPNFLKSNQKPEELILSFEIKAEAPKGSDRASDILFSINDIPLGTWSNPVEPVTQKGLLTPTWWEPTWSQCGFMKILSIRENGTFMDGLQLSKTTIHDLGITSTSDICFRISVPNNSETTGGLTLFGKGFGNYNQGIKAKLKWHPL